MRIIIDLVLLFVPFLYTYWVRGAADTAKKYLNTDGGWPTTNYSKIKWIYLLTFMASTFISSCGAKALSRDAFNSQTNEWMIWILVALVANLMITIGKVREPYKEDQPPSPEY